MLKRFLLAGGILALTSGAAVAHADTMFFLTSGCSLNGPNHCGTVTLTQDGSNVDVSVTLVSGENFVNTGNGSNHQDFNFDLSTGTAGSANIKIDSPTPGTWSVGGSAHPASFGTFNNNLECTSCGPGNSSGNPGPLDFTVDNVTVADFEAVSGTFFVVDIFSNGSTGNVGAEGPGVVPAVPEPSSLALLGSGVLGLAGVVRRRFGR